MLCLLRMPEYFRHTSGVQQSGQGGLLSGGMRSCSVHSPMRKVDERHPRNGIHACGSTTSSGAEQGVIYIYTWTYNFISTQFTEAEDFPVSYSS